MKKLIGIIGLGYWGKNLLRNLIELEVLGVACDSDLKTIEARKKEHPQVRYTSEYEEVFNDKSIDAVIIATPAVTHHELVKAALLKGKDVFVEKPLALTVSEGRELEELARANNRILMVGHILQYHPAIIKLKEMINLGELGKIQYIYSNRLNIGKLRTEENILWSFAPHDISVILMLLNDEPVDVYASGGSYITSGVADITVTTLEFKGSIKGHIFVSWLHPYKEQRLIVVGSKAMAVFDDISEEKLFIYPHGIDWINGRIPVAHKAEYSVVAIDKKEPLKEELIHFMECIEHRRKPKTDAQEGLRVLRVLERAQQFLKGK
jgi:UDP-2-acetamido-3-amino-2,3-dideoxy-glucuronate N-acetyltransferase